MENVIIHENGTGKIANPYLKNARVFGKTGTAENPHGRDHAWFIGWISFKRELYSVVVLMENSGSGGTKAAPIAKQVFKSIYRHTTETGKDVIKKSNLDFKELNLSLYFLAFFLVFIGLTALNSISQQYDEKFLSSPFIKQILLLIPSFIFSLLVLGIPKAKFINMYTIFTFLGLFWWFCRFSFEKHAGTHRWLQIGLPFMIQPSEFAKLFTILALARYLSDHNLQMKKFKSIIFPIIIAIIPTGIVMNQPDLGTSIVILAPVIPMLYWSGANSFYLFLIIAPFLSMLTVFHNVAFLLWALILATTIILSRTPLIYSILLFFSNIFLGLLSPVLWGMLSKYQQNRIITFFNPEKGSIRSSLPYYSE